MPTCADDQVTHTGDEAPVVVVDAANVVGSVPDGWWRDRHAATERLRDRLASVARTGIAGIAGPIRVILVTEGQARNVAAVTDVEVVAAAVSGDDAIVGLIAALVNARPSRGSTLTVVTADRELRSRVLVLGAEVIGPKSIPR